MGNPFGFVRARKAGDGCGGGKRTLERAWGPMEVRRSPSAGAVTLPPLLVREKRETTGRGKGAFGEQEEASHERYRVLETDGVGRTREREERTTSEENRREEKKKKRLRGTKEEEEKGEKKQSREREAKRRGTLRADLAWLEWCLLGIERRASTPCTWLAPRPHPALPPSPSLSPSPSSPPPHLFEWVFRRCLSLPSPFPSASLRTRGWVWLPESSPPSRRS